MKPDPDGPCLGSRFLALGLGALLLCQSCSAGWHQSAGLGTEPLQPRQQVQVWREGTMARWHSVVVTADTVSGIHFLEPLDCDSCRVALDRASVDSIRLGIPSPGFGSRSGCSWAPCSSPA